MACSIAKNYPPLLSCACLFKKFKFEILILKWDVCMYEKKVCLPRTTVKNACMLTATCYWMAPAIWITKVIMYKSHSEPRKNKIKELQTGNLLMLCAPNVM